MWIQYNPNPYKISVGDCVIRAITKVLDTDWDTVYWDLAICGFWMGDMPSSNAVWGQYLRENGFNRSIIPNSCPDCYTVREFCIDNPVGTYVLATGSHAIAVIDGNYYDSFDSGNETVIFFYKRGE